MTERQVFIGNLCNISNEALRTYCEVYGPLSEITYNRDKENNVYHCFAFVTFQYNQHIKQFMLDRPHSINDKEVFVKRALPRLTSSIPERLIVTNRLIIQDFTEHNKRTIRNYFQKFGEIKNFDVENGFIDFQDYDDVDRILLARPHYIHDREVIVTKYSPSEQSLPSDNQQRYRSKMKSEHRYLNKDETSDRIATTSTERRKRSSTQTFKHNSSDTISANNENNEDNRSNTFNYLNNQYESLRKQFDEYKKSKESEISCLKTDLEHIKQQLHDATQEKLDRLLQKQEEYQKDLINHLISNITSNHIQSEHETFQSNINNQIKKRKLSSNQCEFEFYS